MSQMVWQRWLLVGGLTLSLTNLAVSSNVQAQLIPDNTLGSENSTVMPQGVQELIGGGASRGSNLFHSFSEFNVGNNQQVYFANPAGITNILTRVTGTNLSHILGTLGVEGTANLFLINPNGIIFGPNARLDVAGSFIASTADGIKLGEAGLFSARAPETSTLLNIQPGVLFLNALRSQPAEISNQGSLAVGTGQTLTLQADTVTSTGNLTAPGGTVQVLGNQVNLLNNASINVSSPTGGGTVLMGNGEQINIAPSVRIRADALNQGNGGNVMIKSQGTTNFDGYISARGGANSGNGGFVEVSGTNLQFSGTVDTTAAWGQVGTLLLDPKDILIQSEGPISGLAVSGLLLTTDVVLQANNDIIVNDDIGTTTANSLTFLAGRSLTIAPHRTIALNGGNLTAKINDENALAVERDPGLAQFFMSPGSRLLTNGGNVTIASGIFDQTSQINTANGTIQTGSLAGNGGNITLLALGDITTGLLDSRSNIGNGGNIAVTSTGGAIATTNVMLSDALLQAGGISLTAAGNLSINGNITSFGGGAGAIALTSGGLLSARNTAIANAILGPGTAKDITLTARSINLDNSSVTALTAGAGQGGGMQLNVAEEIVLRNSGLGPMTYSGSGHAGNLTLNTRRLRIIQESDPNFTPTLIPGFDPNANPLIGATGIATSTGLLSSGNAGDLTVNASESVEIIGNQPGAFTIIPSQGISLVTEIKTGMSTSALGSGNSGNLTVNTGRLAIRDGAGITTFPTIGEGGDVTVNAAEVFLQGKGGITTITLGSGKAGDLTINADQLNLTDGASIVTGTFGSGKGGDLTLSVRRLSLRNGPGIGTTTLGDGDSATPDGDSGTLTVKNAELIELIGTSPDGSFGSGLYAEALSMGNAEELNITAEQLNIEQGGQISTRTLGQGQGGSIQINTDRLRLDNGRINASTIGSGKGGDINIRASSSVELIGAGYDALQQQIILPVLNGTLSLTNFNQGIVTITAGEGQAGIVTIETPNFIARDGALIATTTLGEGEGGNITINTSDTLELDNSLLGTGTFTNASSGDVNLTARQLTAKGGAQVLTTTFSSGTAGNLTVKATDAINLLDPNNSGRLLTTGLFASSAITASGNGGDITIDIPTGDLNIRDGAAVSVSALGEGNAGDINITARSVFLDRGAITATSTSGKGGNITMRISDFLILRHNSQISTRAGTQESGGGNGGNIDIDPIFILAVPQENSDITANAFAGNGGNITLTAQGIFGLQVSEQLTPLSDITASSQLGINGNITLNTPDVDPARGLIELPSNLSDPANQIVAGCPADTGNSFTIAGRGGIPDHPSQYLRGRAVWQDTRNLSQLAPPLSPLTTNQQPTPDRSTGLDY
ncbi:MAG TPA: hypothetical protein DDZ80_12775 [Cyanobacteria bacterium UBA8803]|nr:hypothetical protein [Cyanobacteria bacterium UBA8803]